MQRQQPVTLEMTSAGRRPPPSRTVRRYRVLLLGPFALHLDDVPIDVGAWPQHAGTVLRLLASTPGHRRPREEVADILWPEASAEAGANNLRSLLHRLRRAMATGDPPPMVLERGWLMLNPACSWEIDLEAFEELSLAGEVDALEGAVGLYRGEPLAEDRYQDWAIPVRVRLERTWRDVCMRLGQAYHQRGLEQQAATCFQRVLLSDPLDEAALQNVMLTLAACGRRAEALRLFRQFEQRLREELELSPTPETKALVDELEESSSRSRPLPTSTGQQIPVIPSYDLATAGPFVGRDAEVEDILTMLAEAGEADSSRLAPRLVLIAAEAGMGKTRLLAEIAARARETGALTLAAGCFEQEGQLPYGPLHDALLDYLRTQPEGVVQAQLGDLMPDLGRIVPELRARFASAGEPGSREPEGQRLRLFAAVAQAFERIAAHLPLLLLLDDLHSADDATLQALHFLLRQPVSACVIVVGAYRPEEVATSSVLADIVAGAGYPLGAHPEGPRRIHTLSLAPLSDAEMAVLLKMRLRGRCAESLVRSVQEWSEGNPLFALEMVGLLEQEARLERLDDGWSLRAGMRIDLPRAVRDMMARHLRRLRPETRRALALGSVLGRAFDHATLAALWEGDPISLFEALDEAREAALLTESDGRYAFRHPLLRETVYDAITAPQRSLLHGQAGLAIEEISSSAAGASARRDYESELAHHFVAAAGYPLGGPLGSLGATFNERAVRYSILAGKAAENVFAYNQAAQHYRAALRLCRLLGDPSREAEALERLAALARTSAQGGEALELLAQAHRIYRELADDDGQARVMAQMGWEHYNRGTPEEGLAQLESALPELERHSSPSALASLYVSLSCLFRGRERHDESLVAAQRATELARAAGDDRLLTLARGREGMALSMMGREDEALRLFEEVIPRADMEGDLDTLERALYNAADVRLYRGEPHKSKEYQERALRVAEQMGDLRTMARVMASLAHSTFVLGEWDLAGKYADRACTLIPSGYPACALSSASPLCMAGELHLAQGQTQKASRCLEQSVALARRLGDSVVECLAQRALAECDLVWGHPEAAQARLEPLLDRPGQEEISVRPLLPVLAAAYLQTQDLDRAEKYALTAVRRARQPHYRCALVDALRIQGMVLTRRGRTAEARQALDDALSLARATPYPYGEARTLHAYGLIDLREKPEEARRQLEDALTIFRRLGAHPDIERVEAVLGLEKQARNH